MSNLLDNGAVLPFGLLGDNLNSAMDGFNKSYKNTALRVGVVVATYPKNSPKNSSRLTTEYDVVVFEQNEDRGATSITYKNCMAAEGMGSIADFFEKTLRRKKRSSVKGGSVNSKGQDGAIVLVQCLDGFSDKAIVVGSLVHPDRKTTLVDDSPHLEGEYNGVRIKIGKDGSCSLLVKGATDNDGKVVGNSKTVTISVDADKNVTISGDANLSLNIKGNANLNVSGDIVAKCANATVTATGNFTANCVEALVNASGSATVEGATVKLGKGASESAVLGDSLKKYMDQHVHPTSLGPSGAPMVPMPPSTLSKKVQIE